MRSRNLIALPLVAAALYACSNDTPPPAGEPGAQSTPDSSVPVGQVRADGGAKPDGGGGDASRELDAGSDGPPAYEPGPSVCNAAMTLGAATSIALTAGADRFFALTPDERTVAWTVAEGDVASLRVADRGSAADAFEPAIALPGVVAQDGIAVDPSGLGLVAVAEDKKSFVQYERPARGEPFALVATGELDRIRDALGAGELLGDPVFAAGDLVLVYSVYGASDATVRFATRLSSGSSFDPGGRLDFPELRAASGARRRPTGIGADFQTLFYWDEVSGTERLGRLKGTIGFFGVRDLGAYRGAQPNEGCDRIYFGTTDVRFAAPL